MNATMAGMLGCAVLIAGLIGIGDMARAADHKNLEENLPLTVEDAYPIGYLGREFQLITRYERGEKGEDRYLVEPVLEFGFPRNGELSISGPFLWGEGEPDGCDDVTLEQLYLLNQETRVLPAFAVIGKVHAPTGPESEGVDWTLKMAATKTLSRSWYLHQLHANFAWTFNEKERPGERDGFYEAVLGYSARINNETMFLADFVRDEDIERGIESNIFEAGVRYMLTPYAVLSGGVGFGVGDDSPDIRATLGIQISLFGKYAMWRPAPRKD